MQKLGIQTTVVLLAATVAGCSSLRKQNSIEVIEPMHSYQAEAAHGEITYIYKSNKENKSEK
jgi:hypothetical protein